MQKKSPKIISRTNYKDNRETGSVMTTENMMNQSNTMLKNKNKKNNK